MKEYLLTTNNFGEPTILDGNDARGISLLRLLLFTPGHNPLFPAMGCGLVQKRHMMESEIPGTESDISDQISTYLPECMFDKVELTKSDDNYIIITITCEDGTAYSFNSDNYGFPVLLSDFKSDNV